MKLKQMEYAIAVARTGSFTQAAKEMYVSQPNISAGIIALEEEVGIKIFNRSNTGVELTSEGYIFIQQTKKALADIKQIPNIVKKQSYNELRIGNMFPHTAVTQAFIKLCLDCQNNPKLHLSLYSSPSKTIVEDVYRNKCDLGIIFEDSIMLDQYIKGASGKNIDFDTVFKLNLNVNLRNGHPLLEDENFDFSKLKDYPFVNYNYDNSPFYSISQEYPRLLSKDIINFDKIINVDEKENRREIVLATDAYSIGASFHPKTRSTEQITSIPIPDIYMSFVIVTRKDHPHCIEQIKFLEYLKAEVEKLQASYTNNI